jgi:hypothetical protein
LEYAEQRWAPERSLLDNTKGKIKVISTLVSEFRIILTSKFLLITKSEQEPLYCPYNDKNCRAGKYCKISVWSTPTNPEYFAQHLKRVIDKCTYNEEREDELL